MTKVVKSGMVIFRTSRFFRMCLFRSSIPVNPRLAGGGANIAPPLPNFLDSSKTAADIDAKFSAPSPASTWRPPTKFQKKVSWNFWGNNGLVTQCFAILVKKTAECLKTYRMYSFEVKRNKKKRQKTQNWTFYKIVMSNFGYLLFVPPNLKIWFFKNKSLPNPKLKCYQYTGICALKPHASDGHAE